MLEDGNAVLMRQLERLQARPALQKAASAGSNSFLRAASESVSARVRDGRKRRQHVMRRFAILALAVSLWALPAAAGDGHDRDHGRHNGHELKADRFAEVALQLERAAHHVHARAEKFSRHRGRRQALALGALHRLEVQASRFRDRTERGYTPTSWERSQLLRAYHRAEARFGDLRAVKRLEGDFARVERAVERLDRVYAKRSRERDRYAAYRPIHRHRFEVAFGWPY